MDWVSLCNGLINLEGLSVKKGLNKFALKAKLYIKATQMAFEQLQILRSETA